MERAEIKLRARSVEEGGLEASRCFLRAMLVGIDDAAPVPDDLLARVSEFLKIDLEDLVAPPQRPSVRPPSANPLASVPGERPRRVLFLGRSDPARVAMIEAVARSVLADEVEIRAASLAPAPVDARALRVIRHAGYSTDGVHPRAVSVDDLSWADLVVTVGGEREDWERFLPRSTAHQHESIEDPVGLARGLETSRNELEPFRMVLRAVERMLGALRPPRATKVPTVAPPRAPSSPRLPALGAIRTPHSGFEPNREATLRSSRPALERSASRAPALDRLRTPVPFEEQDPPTSSPSSIRLRSTKP
jgi:protein-tyrosine-phosphatase